MNRNPPPEINGDAFAHLLACRAVKQLRQPNPLRPMELVAVYRFATFPELLRRRPWPAPKFPEDDSFQWTRHLSMDADPTHDSDPPGAFWTAYSAHPEYVLLLTKRIRSYLESSEGRLLALRSQVLVNDPHACQLAQAAQVLERQGTVKHPPGQVPSSAKSAQTHDVKSADKKRASEERQLRELCKEITLANLSLEKDFARDQLTKAGIKATPKAVRDYIARAIRDQAGPFAWHENNPLVFLGSDPRAELRRRKWMESRKRTASSLAHALRLSQDAESGAQSAGEVNRRPTGLRGSG